MQAAATYWHGGVAGLEKGARILSPSASGTNPFPLGIPEGLASYDVGRRDRVYFTTDRELARVFASLETERIGRGALYQVRPEGVAQPDPDFEPVSWQSRSAVIVAVAESDVQMTDRERNKATGQYETWDDGSPLYESDGRVFLTERMRNAGIRQADLDARFDVWAGFEVIVSSLRSYAGTNR